MLCNRHCTHYFLTLLSLIQDARVNKEFYAEAVLKAHKTQRNTELERRILIEEYYYRTYIWV